jgi:hypothetical protein
MQATGRCTASVRHSAYLHQRAAAVFGAAASGTRKPRQWPVDSKAVIRVAVSQQTWNRTYERQKQHAMKIQQTETERGEHVERRSRGNDPTFSGL